MKLISTSTTRRHIVIAGGGYAGVAAAFRLARYRLPGTQITLINDSDRFVERIRLHQRMVGQAVGQRSLAKMLRGAGIDLLVGRIEHVDAANRTISLRANTTVGWDQLVLALGSDIHADNVPGAAEHATMIGTGTTAAIYERLIDLQRRHGRVLVAGGGLTGIEMAAEIAETFPDVSVEVISRDPLGHELSPAARDYLQRTFAALNIRVHQETAIARVHERAVQTQRGALSFDLCLWSAGFRGHSLAQAAGLATNGRGHALVDATLRSLSHPHVRVVGDLASVDSAAGRMIPLGCKSALPLGVHAAECIVAEVSDRPLVPFSFRPLFYSISLGRRTGLIQMMDATGQPHGQTITGREAARFKEFICRSAFWQLNLERIGLSGIQWAQRAVPEELISKSA